MIRIASPRHRSSPAVSASWWPWLRDRLTATTMRISASDALHHRPAAVARPVVDQHDLVIVARGLARGRAQPLVQLGEAGFLVEAGNDDRQRRSWLRLIEDASAVRARPASCRRPFADRMAADRSARHSRNRRADRVDSEWSIIRCSGSRQHSAAPAATGRPRNSRQRIFELEQVDAFDQPLVVREALPADDDHRAEVAVAQHRPIFLARSFRRG